MNFRSQQCDAMKNEFARELILANNAQKDYYGKHLADVINEMQAIEEEKLKIMKDVLTNMVLKGSDYYCITKTNFT